MKQMRLITTSWDDGHVLDFKLAELLEKYNLKGTFYIPRHNAEHTVMNQEQLIELAKMFEIGGHTINHVRLKIRDEKKLMAEIKGCFNWLEELLGYPPVSFCFPGGIYSPMIIKMVFDCGFKIARSTELLSIKKPLNGLMPTTLQVYNHSANTYIKHLAKRQLWSNFMGWLTSNSLSNLQKLTESYLRRIESSTGCFHLWGHSWEIDEYGLWGKLEAIFKIMANRPSFTYIPNNGILNY